MKIFTIKITVLLLMVMSTVFLVNYISFCMIKKASFELPRNIEILILGDSHTECAIDDTLLPNSINVSNSADAFIFSYIKLKKFAEENVNIKTVLLSMHAESLSNRMDRWIYKPDFILGRITSYLPFLNKREVELVVFPNFIKILHNSSQQSLKFLVLNIFKKNIDFHDLKLGQFHKSKKSILNKNVKHDIESNDIHYISSVQLEYLGKIIDFCEAEKIHLILINTPIYNSIKYYSSDYIYTFLRQKFKTIDIIDNSKFAIKKDGFGDLTHLNSLGSKVYTQYLKKELENHLVITK